MPTLIQSPSGQNSHAINLPADRGLDRLFIAYFNKGDWSVAYSPALEEMFSRSDLPITRVECIRPEGANSSTTLSVIASRPLDDDQKKAIGDILTKHTTSRCFLDEDDLINDANAITPENGSLAGTFAGTVQEYVTQNFLPFIIDKTGHQQASISFVRLAAESESGPVSVEITLGGSCQSCASSMMSTLTMLNRGLREFFQDRSYGGLVVLPNGKGSPSLSLPAPAA